MHLNYAPNLAHFITLTATARVLNVSVTRVASFQIWANVVWVHIRGQRPTFVSISAYRQDFLAVRKAAAQKVTLKQLWSDEWKTLTGHTIITTKSKVICNCPDYTTQQRWGNGKSICKHTIAVRCVLQSSQLLAVV